MVASKLILLLVCRLPVNLSNANATRHTPTSNIQTHHPHPQQQTFKQSTPTIHQIQSQTSTGMTIKSKTCITSIKRLKWQMAMFGESGKKEIILGSALGILVREMEVRREPYNPARLKA